MAVRNVEIFNSLTNTYQSIVTKLNNNKETDGKKTLGFHNDLNKRFLCQPLH